MANFFDRVIGAIQSTKIPEQMDAVDYMALLQNSWFIVPFTITILYLLFKKEFKTLSITAVVIVVWLLTGTEFFSGLIVNGEIQISKILPVVFGGAVSLIVIVYLLFSGD